MASKAIGFLNFKFGADLKGFDRAMKKAQKNLKKFGKNVQRTGQNLTSSLTLPIAGLAAVSLKTFADFEQGMLKVKAISGATDTQMKMLTETAKELGRTTSFSASQVSELQLELSKLGFTPEQIDAASASVLSLAQATGIELGFAAETTAVALNAFGLTASDSGKVADILAKASSNAAVDMEKLNAMLPNVAAVAKASGEDLESLTSKIMALADKTGMEGGKLGTHMKIIFKNLAESGMSFEEAMLKIQNATNKNSVAMELFGGNAFGSAIALSEVTDKAALYEQQLIHSGGAAQEMAEIMESGLAGSMRKMRSQLEGAAIQLGEILVPVFQAVINKISKLVSWFSGLSSETQKSIVKWALFIATLGPFLIIVGKISLGISSLIGIFVTLRNTILVASASFKIFMASMVRMTAAGWAANGMLGAMTGAFRVLKTAIMTNPIGILIGTLALAAGAFLSYTQSTIDATVANDEFEGSVESTEEKIKRLSKSIGDMGKDSFQLQIEEIEALIKKIKGFEVKESAFTKGVGLTDEQKKQIQDLNMLLFQLKQKQFEAKQEADELAKSIENVGGAVGDLGDEVEEVSDDWTKNMSLIGDTVVWKEAEEAMSSVEDQFKGLVVWQTKLTDAQKLAKAGFQMFGDVLTSSLDEALSSQEKFFPIFIKNIKRAIQSLLVQLAVMTLISAIMPGTMGGLGKAAFTKGGILKNLSSLMNIPAMADGGVVMGPQMALIGEAGPEAVIPLDQLKNFGGSQQVEVVGKISGNDIFLSNRNTGTNRQRSV